MRIFAIMAVVCTFASSCNFVPGKVIREINDEIIDELDMEVISASKTFITKTYEFENIDRIECSYPLEIIYTQGPQSVQLNGPDNVIETIQMKVENGLLKISSKQKKVRGSSDVKLYLSTQSLVGITANGAVDLETRGAFKTEKFNILANGASEIDIERIDVGNLTLDVNGSADAEISNIECINLNVMIKGAGDCELSGHTKEAFVSVMGAASVDVSDLRADVFNSSVKGAGVIERD